MRKITFIAAILLVTISGLAQQKGERYPFRDTDTSIRFDTSKPVRINFGGSITLYRAVVMNEDSITGKLNRLEMNQDSSISIHGDTMSLIKQMLLFWLESVEKMQEKYLVIRAGADFFNSLPCKKENTPELKRYLELLRKEGFRSTKGQCK